MKETAKYIFLYIFHLVYLPHLILYKMSKEKNKIDEDVKVMAKHCNAPYTRSMGLVYFLFKYRSYRNIFYTRIGSISKICSWYLPREKTFVPCRNMAGGVYAAHPICTLIDAKYIGKNCSFRHGTTIGNIFDGKNEDFPVIQDDVYLGSNVSVLGDITIGRGCIVGAGAIVRKSLPPYSIVVGNPAKIVGFRFRPEDIVEYEKKYYPEDERLPLDLLERNYKKYYLDRLLEIKNYMKI